MTRIFSVLLALAIVGSAASAQATPVQDKPNVAGTWKLSDPAQPDQTTATQIVVSQDASLLTVVMTTGQMGAIKTTYNLDGSPGKSPATVNGTTIDRTTKMSWNDRKLTLTNTTEVGGQAVEFKRVISLGADGSMTVESTFPDFQGGGAPITAKAVYKKADR